MKINRVPINFQDKELDEQEYKEISKKNGTKAMAII